LSFAYTAELSDTTNINTIYTWVVVNQEVTVSDREGINGLPFATSTDGRIPILPIPSGIGTIYADANVTSGGAPLTMASGIEAQLLIAEEALSAGQINTWTSILNNLRQNAITPSVPLLGADSTTSASPTLQLAVMFRERAFWLFETGHRLGDLRRLVRQYGLSPNSVYPTGPYLGGPASYGTSVVYPVGGDSYNPNYHGCINTNA
jgi:starch-binding outer membrane protein, SusD/RagB family